MNDPKKNDLADKMLDLILKDEPEIIKNLRKQLKESLLRDLEESFEDDCDD